MPLRNDPTKPLPAIMTPEDETVTSLPDPVAQKSLQLMQYQTNPTPYHRVKVQQNTLG